MRWAGHAAYIGNTSSTCKILLDVRRIDQLGDLCTDGRKMLKQISEKMV
jgi:hypothetical protein